MYGTVDGQLVGEPLAVDSHKSCDERSTRVKWVFASGIFIVLRGIERRSLVTYIVTKELVLNLDDDFPPGSTGIQPLVCLLCAIEIEDTVNNDLAFALELSALVQPLPFGV